MKKIYFLLLAMAVYQLHAQNVGIGTANPKNKLHVAGGLRVDSLSNNKDSGIILHNKSGDVYSLKLTGKQTDVLTGAGTFASLAATGSWNLNGNAGTDSTVNFLGTTDNRPLVLRINNHYFGKLGANILIGKDAYSADWTKNNIAIGNNAMQLNSGGDANVAIGNNTMIAVSGNRNVAIGDGAFGGRNGPDYTWTGDENVAIGADALSLGNGGGNTAVGAFTLKNSDYSGGNTAIGYYSSFQYTGNSGYPAGSNTAVGAFSLYSNRLGAYNTAIGYQSLYSSDGEMFYSTAVGYQSLFANTTGFSNTAIGTWSLLNNTTGNANTAQGYQSLYSNTTASNNIAFGSEALLKNTTGANNSAVGTQALNVNSTGSYNQAFGYKALFLNTTGINNTATGYRTLYNNTTGAHNSAVGYIALTTNTTGSYNTAIGEYADVSVGNLSNATAIGYNAKVNASNKVRIGNASVTKIEGQVPFTTPSDGRFKFNIREDVKGLDFILKLRPVTYQFDVSRFDGISINDKNSATWASYNKAELIRRTGFIAQEVEKAAIDSRYDFSGIDKPASADDHYSLSYESFVVPLVKAVQEQQEMIKVLQENIKQQQIEIELLKQHSK